MELHRLSLALASAALAGSLGDVAGLAERLAVCVERRPEKLLTLAGRIAARFGGLAVRPRRREVVAFLTADRGVRRNAARVGRVVEWVGDAAAAPMLVVGLPVLATVRELAEWLCLGDAELEWMADLKGIAREGRLHHYRYTVREKADGSLRLIEAPKQRLKEAQRRILAEILDLVPVLHCVHGFVRGRSIASFAAPHAGQRVVVRMDLRDFFPTIIGARVQTVFRMLGYPEMVADRLGGLCTNAVPRSSLSSGLDAETAGLYRRPHLPQGAPTSPALANLCAHVMDKRLSALGRSAGAFYTRYADDLAFSGGEEFERRADRFAAYAAAVVMEEGFQVNHRKTRVMRQGVRQHLAGLVVNQRLNVGRREFDEFKAMLTNRARGGAVVEERAHLLGRLSFFEMVNPGKAARLRRVFERIEFRDRL